MAKKGEYQIIPPGYGLPDGRWKLTDCPRCGSERVYRDRWSANVNKNNISCEKCRSRKYGIEIGFRFGNWLVIEGPFYKTDPCRSKPAGYTKWICRCRCGNESLVIADNLLKGQSRKCNKCKSLSDGRANFNAVYYQTKKRAEQKGLEWELDESQFAFLVSQPCVYCSVKNSNNYNTHRGEFLSNGIDRISSSHGYTLGNVTSCCKTCNYAKRKMTTREFSEFVSRASCHPDQADDLWNKWAERIRTITYELPYVVELDIYYEGRSRD